MNSAPSWGTWKRERVAQYAGQPGTAAIQPADDTAGAAQKPGFAFWVFCLYVFIVMTRPQDYLTVLAPLRLALGLSYLMLLLTVVGSAEARRGALNNVESRFYLGFFVVMCLGIPFAIYRHAAYDFVIRQYFANVLFFVLFVVHVNTPARLRHVGWVLTVGALIFSVFGLTRGHFVDGRFSTGSPMFDANDVPFILIALLPFPVSALMGGRGLIQKGIALASVLLSVLLALYSGSRGGLVGIATFLLLFLALGIPRVRKAHKILFILALVVLAFANANKINLNRYRTLGTLQDDYNVSDEFGRAQIWKRGLQLFWDSPLTGVGAACFPEAIGRMREEAGTRPEWQTAHNSYVQVLTETGVPGAVAFALLLGACLISFVNRYRRTRGAFRQVSFDALPALLVVGYLSMLVAGTFLSQAYSMPFTLYFALSATLKRIAGAPAPASQASFAVSPQTRLSNA